MEEHPRGRSLAEAVARQFSAWEIRGRSWLSYPYPVELEPPFEPFPGYALPRAVDDGRRPTSLSRFMERLFGRPSEAATEEEAFEEPEIDPEPFYAFEPLAEFLVAVPEGTAVALSQAEGFLWSLQGIESPLSFEITGSAGEIALQVTCRESDAPMLQSELEVFFPAATVTREPERLASLWHGARGAGVVVEFGLEREFLVPLGTPKGLDPDPLLPVYGALQTLSEGEVAVFQVLFQSARAPWEESMLRAVSDREGRPLFDPELSAGAEKKAERPLFAACLRIGARSSGPDGPWRIAYDLAGALKAFGGFGGNGLTPLGESEEDLERDLLLRETHRSGMLLSSAELVSLVHLPPASVRVPSLRRSIARTKPAPGFLLSAGPVIGENAHKGRTLQVRLPSEARARHLHLVGASGTGKSTLLLSLIAQDIEAGQGVALLDPHGDLVDAVLARIPPERMENVVLFDPSDQEALVGWNFLAASSELEKILLSSDLVGIFRRFATSWGDQMTSVLANAILIFLESPRGGTLVDLRQFLADPKFRGEILSGVADPHLRFYWEREFPLLGGGKSVGSILTRLDTFLRSKLVRRILAERESRLDFREILDRGGIFLGKLSQGAIGEENAALLGSLIVAKLHQAALSRQDLLPEERRPFFLYVDECQHFATPSMAGLLSGARKYALSLTAAHQELSQLRLREPEVSSALLANAGTRIVFRVGEEDARELAKGFSFFEAQDLLNLGIGEAVCRVGRASDDFNLKALRLPPVSPEEARERRLRVIARTRERFPPREEALPAIPPAAPVPAPQRAAPEREREPQPASLPIVREPLAPQPSEAGASPPTEETRLPGKGGPEHVYFQELIKRWAEERGFRAAVEEQVPGTRESIDVALYRGETRIACEITVTTPLEYEAGNVKKCLAAGFGRVAVMSLKKGRLQKLEKLLAESLSPEERERVLLLTPEEFLSWLSELPAQEGTGMVGGYKVKVRYKAPENTRTNRVAEILARSMSRLKKEGS